MHMDIRHDIQHLDRGLRQLRGHLSGVLRRRISRFTHRFMLDIIELEKIYDWQTAVLPLALQFHEELTDDGLCSNPSRWTLDRQYVDRFCNATRLKSVHLNQLLADKVPPALYAASGICPSLAVGTLILLSIICFRFV
ncbi:hypothetical protein V8E54_010534 [Elaphomyces granulatus]